MSNNVTNDAVNIISNNYVVDISGINSLDIPHNNDFGMNSGEIMLFQSSDGSLHTIELTPEQIAELGLQVQYTSVPLSTDELKHEEVEEPETVADETLPVDNASQVLSQRIVFNHPQVEIPPQEPIPLHRVVRVSELSTRGRGFQLITDHIGEDSHLKTSDSNSLIKPRISELSRSNGTIKKSNIFLRNNSPKRPDNAESVFTGKFILTHNDIGSFKPDPKNSFGNAKSVLLSNMPDNKYTVKTAKLASVQSQNTPTIAQKAPTRNAKAQNGILLKAISPNLKKTLNIKDPLTPIPFVPKPPRKILLPEDPTRIVGWNPAQPRQTVHVLQSGDQYQSVEKLNGEQLRVVTDALSNVVARPDNKNNVLYDPASKTRIVYRVVYPEDLNLYSASTLGEENKKPKKDRKPKTVLPPAPQTPQVVSVTRSGRRVRLPRHMAMDYERPEEEGEGEAEAGAPPSAPSLPAQDLEEEREATERKVRQMFGTPSMPASTHRKRFPCPLCRKVYRGANRMARHLVVFPDHAITPKASEILEKYKTENQAKEIKPKVARKAAALPQELQNTTINHSITGVPHTNSSVLSGTESKVAESKISINEDLECKEERSLYTSLVGILERTSVECRAAVFVRQLAALTIKLRKLMPCLLYEDKENSSCIINEPVGKMLDVSPGKYRLNMKAIKCSGEQSENCTHITPKQSSSTPSISVTTNDSWMSNNGQTNHDKTPQMDDCGRKQSLDKWTTNVGKRKWIPIGSQNTNDEHSSANDENWLTSSSEMMMDRASFSQTVGDLKSWDSPRQKQSRVSESTPGSPWRANIAELAKVEIPQEIPPRRHIIEPSNQPVQSDDSISFDCTSKIVDMHSNLVFDMKTQIALDSNNINMKNDLSRNGQSACGQTVSTVNYDFNDSRFDMQIDSDKLNFTSAQYNEMKYGRDALPPFRKIEPSKNLQHPVDSLSDISSDGDKLHLPTGDAILGDDSAYQITAGSLGLSMENNHIVGKSEAMDPNESTVHCDGQSLLNSSDLNLPISNANTLSRNESMLSVSESSLDGGRLNLSSSQSVLHLLDPLGADCLSFADSELRPTSQMSLDLQLDLFPFHHP